MTEEEYQRERNRLKQVRFRKRKQAIAEGKAPDFYITDEDYIDREDTETIAAPAQYTPARNQERNQEEEQESGFPWLLLIGGLLAGGAMIFIPIFFPYQGE